MQSGLPAPDTEDRESERKIHPSMVNPKSVRTLFVVVAVALLIQYGIIGLLSLGPGEPWPAVIQPGFKNVWDGGDTVRIPHAELEVTMDSGRMQPVALEKLFEGIPASHHLGILRAQFQPSSLSGSGSTEKALLPESRIWLRERLRQLFPDYEALSMHAVWKEVQFDRASQTTSTRAIDTLVIELETNASRTHR